MDAAAIDADFLICAGYKWLLGPYGTGFLWVKAERIEKMRPGPFNWLAAVADPHAFAALNFEEPKPPNNARRWDAAETISPFNLSAWEVSLELVQRIGPETVAAHNRKLIELLLERLPKDRCVPASPMEASRRGPYACFAARTPEKTAELFEALKKENVVVSLREGNLRVAPHLYNTERNIDKLISVITV